MKPIRLTISWADAKEYIRLRMDSLPAESIRTEEDWLDGSILKVYNPRVVLSAMQADGSHLIKLEYLQADHPEHEGTGVIWGMSTIHISADQGTASVNWKSSPSREDDGEASCQITQEHVTTDAEREFISRHKRSQAKFKADLFKRESQCVASGESFSAALEAAHLLDVEHLGPSIPENGVLLRADLHKLFDDGYFSITESGDWEFHKNLPSSYRIHFQSVGLPKATYERVKEFIPKRRKREPLS